MDISALSNIAVDNITCKGEGRLVHVIPEFKSNLINHIKTLGIKPNSIYEIISPTKNITLAGKTFNSKEYTQQLKVLLKQKDVNIIVDNDLPKELLNNKFIIMDHSILSQAISHISELASEKQAAHFLFSSLKETFLTIKKSHSTIKQSILFPLNKYENGMINILNYLTKVSKEDLNTDFNAFDDMILVSITPDEKVVSVIPIIKYDEKGHLEIFKTNLNKIDTKLKSLEKDKLKENSKENLLNKASQNKTITDLANAKINTNQVKQSDGFYKPVLDIDQKSLSNILKHYKIKDMTISSNIKTTIDKYLKTMKPDPEILDKEKLEQLVLKSIHYSLFQTDNVREEFLHDPNLLFKKLVDINNHSIELNIPTLRKDQLINPQDLIDLKNINNIRTQYELDENIHDSIKDLFNSLSTKKSAPIKILNIKHEYKDDNMNRYLEYTATVKNMTGGSKEPYDLTIKLPALVNNRYLKLNSNAYILLSQQYLTPFLM